MWVRACVAAAAVFLIGCEKAPPAEAKRETLDLGLASFASAAATPMQNGKRLASLLGCKGCHKVDLQGAVWDEEPEFGIFAPTNLTRSAARYTDQQLERMIREGVRPDGSHLWEMPSEAYTHLSARDMLALLAYMRSLPAAGPERPRPTFGPEGREERAAGTLLSAPEKVAKERNREPWHGGTGHERGRYIARLACGECHGPQLTGNQETIRPDLIVASGYSLNEFRKLLRTGEPTGGRELALMAKVARSRFVHLTDEEVQALHGYLVARAQQLR